MSSYPPPIDEIPIFNKTEFPSSKIDSNLDQLFVPKRGGTFSGSILFNLGLTSNAGLTALGTISGNTLTDGFLTINDGNLTNINNVTTSGLISSSESGLDSVPTFYLSNGGGAGLYKPASDTLGITVNSSKIMEMNNTEIEMNSALVSVSNNMDVNGNITSTANIQGLTLTDGTATLTGGLWNGITTLNAGVVETTNRVATTGRLSVSPSGINTQVNLEQMGPDDEIGFVFRPNQFNDTNRWDFYIETQGASTNDLVLRNRVSATFSEIVRFDFSVGGATTFPNNLISQSTVEGATLTDGTAILTGGNWTGIGNLTATGTITGATLTNGTASLTTSVLSGISSIVAPTALSFNVNGSLALGITSLGTANFFGNNLTGIGNLTSTGNIQGVTLTDGETTISSGVITIKPQPSAGATSRQLNVNGTSAVMAINRFGGDPSIELRRYSDTGGTTRQAYYDIYLTSAGSLVFRDRQSGDNNVLICDSSQNISIPNGNLEVSGSITASNKGSFTTTSGRQLDLVYDDGVSPKTWHVEVSTGDDFRIVETGAAEWLTIANSTGNASFGGDINLASTKAINFAGDFNITNSRGFSISSASGTTNINNSVLGVFPASGREISLTTPSGDLGFVIRNGSASPSQRWDVVVRNDDGHLDFFDNTNSITALSLERSTGNAVFAAEVEAESLVMNATFSRSLIADGTQLELTGVSGLGTTTLRGGATTTIETEADTQRWICRATNSNLSTRINSIDLINDWDRESGFRFINTDTTTATNDIWNIGRRYNGGVGVTELQFYYFDSSASTTTQCLQVKPAGGILVPSGSASSPSVSFINDTDSGLYLSTTGTVVIASGSDFSTAFSKGLSNRPIQWINAVEYGTGNVTNSQNIALAFETSNNTWGLATTNNNNLSFQYRNGNVGGAFTERGYFRSSLDINGIDFTGQHRCQKPPNFQNKATVGYIVVSTGRYCNSIEVDEEVKVLEKDDETNENREVIIKRKKGKLVYGKEAITINDALPLVEYSSKPNQKTVFGVIAEEEEEDSETRQYSLGVITTIINKVKEDKRLTINAVGEGSIWVCDINGPLENGDYITTCSLEGLGAKQSDGLLHNYTVAKITMDCDFSGGMAPRDDYELKYVDFKGRDITLKRYEKDGGYICAFVGCTYHCG